jgi:hypothetical protein
MISGPGRQNPSYTITDIYGVATCFGKEKAVFRSILYGIDIKMAV